MAKRKTASTAASAAAPVIWRNRITRYGEEDPARLVANEKNWRTHPQAQHEALADALSKVGVVQNVIVNERTGRMVDGHLRVEMAISSGQPTVPITYVDLSDEEEQLILATIDPLTGLAGTDRKLLDSLITDLRLSDLGMDLGPGLNALLDSLSPLPANKAEDEVPDLPENPVSRPGDLWLLGKHRVLCGNATNPTDVARLLDGREPLLLVTDPPYGIELDSEWRDRAGLNGCGPAEASYMKSRTEGHTETTISGDTRADWSEAFELLPSLRIAYVWHASVFTREVLNGLERIGFLYPQQIIWNKGRTVLTRTHYWYQHEPCQPAGTLVAKVIKQGHFREHSVIEQVPIETLQVGDLVVSFARSRIERHGREIRRIGSREYTGNMHEICVGDLRTKATADHQFTIRFDPGRPKYFLHYVMRRRDRWRVGVCGMFNTRGFGLAVRLDQEQGEEAWIISAHPDKRSARVAEQVTSCAYGIPTTHWETDRFPGGESTRDKDDISRIYQQIGNGTISAGVDRLMADRGLKLEHPFYFLL